MALQQGSELAGYTEEEIRQLKREHAIRERDADLAKKRDEEENKRKLELEQEQKRLVEHEAEQAARTANFLAAQAKLRADRKAKNEKLAAKREMHQKEREEDWRRRANRKVQKLIEDNNIEEERIEKELAQARARRNGKIDKARKMRLDEKDRQEQLDMKRVENQERRTTQTLVQELHRIDSIKMEAQEELTSFIQQPFPVPLKQVLAGRMRTVPGVTELLASHKDAREDLKELEGADLPMRALLRKQTLFQYVHDIQAKADEERVKPPEPVPGDTGRGARSPTRRGGPGSPNRTGTSMGRSSAGFRRR